MKADGNSFMLQNKSVVYLSILDREKSPGVEKKIKATLKGAEKNHFATRLWIHPFENDGIIKLKDAISASNEEYIFLRSIGQYNFLLIRELWMARRRGQKIIIDVPTPNRVAIYEIFKGKFKVLTKIKYLAYLIFSGPVPYWFAHRVIQYADEGFWFLLGNLKKTKIFGNGVDIKQIPVRQFSPQWPTDCLQLIGVGSINYWHGYDRLILAIAKLHADSDFKYKITFTIIGDGAVVPDLKKLCKKLDVEQFVRFSGILHGKELYSHYESAHLGVGSLGLYRKKLSIASELKAREYCAYGIPFLASGIDPDFPEKLSFRYVVNNSKEIDTIIDFFKNFDCNYEKAKPLEIRQFAEDNLDYQVKFGQFIKGLI